MEPDTDIYKRRKQKIGPIVKIVRQNKMGGVAKTNIFDEKKLTVLTEIAITPKKIVEKA